MSEHKFVHKKFGNRSGSNPQLVGGGDGGNVSVSSSLSTESDASITEDVLRNSNNLSTEDETTTDDEKTGNMQFKKRNLKRPQQSSSNEDDEEEEEEEDEDHSPTAIKRPRLSTSSSAAGNKEEQHDSKDDEQHDSADIMADENENNSRQTSPTTTINNPFRSSSSIASDEQQQEHHPQTVRSDSDIQLSSQSSEESDDNPPEQSSSSTMAIFNSGSMKPMSISGPQGDSQQLTDTYGPGFKMLQKSGYKAGDALGKTRKGRVEPVQLSTQRGRQGLGTVKGDIDTDYTVSWDHSKEDLLVEERVTWLANDGESIPGIQTMAQEWLKIGKKKMSIDDETGFCREQYLTGMLKAKNVFDDLPDRELRNARTRANPYETIKGVFFQNRAAMKMANMDAVFDWIFTNPKDPFHDNPDTQPSVWVPEESEKLFYFADVCAGPGGFTEYVLWKKGWNSHGFGMTLKGKDDFKLENFHAAHSQLFEPYYGVGGRDGDGDVMNPENLIEFARFVKQSTPDNLGVHMFMADGGFSVAGQENLQEILSKRLYLCQFLCALSVLRPGGIFVCKLFDLFTPFSAGLVYLMYLIFDRISIHKPHTSRPANSERYIIGQNLLAKGSVTVCEYMRIINEKLDGIAKSDEKSEKDVTEIVPMDIMRADKEFYAYLRESNERLADRQQLYLEKYKAFAKNPTLTDQKQMNLRERCLEFWNIPDETRREAPRPSPTNHYYALTQEQDPTWYPKKCGAFKELEQLRVAKSNCSNLDFRFSVVCENKPQLILAAGKRFIFAWEPAGQRWEPMQRFKMFIPKSTLICGELTFAHKGKGKGLQKRPILRIFDAHTLGGVKIEHLPFDERMSKIRKFCAAVSHRYSHPDAAQLVAAETWKGTEIPRHKSRYSKIGVRGMPRLALYNYELKPDQEPSNDNEYIICKGMTLHRIVDDPWLVCWSRSNKKVYYWSPPKDSKEPAASIFEPHWKQKPELVLTFQKTAGKRLFWDWNMIHGDVGQIIGPKPGGGEGDGEQQDATNKTEDKPKLLSLESLSAYLN